MKERILLHLYRALVQLNIGIAILVVVWLPKNASFRYRDGFDYFIASREWGNFPLIMVASILISRAIYNFVSACLADIK